LAKQKNFQKIDIIFLINLKKLKSVSDYYTKQYHDKNFSRQLNEHNCYVPLQINRQVLSAERLDEWISDFPDVNNVNLKANVKKKPSKRYWITRAFKCMFRVENSSF
jgi:hypothetical protein